MTRPTGIRRWTQALALLMLTGCLDVEFKTTEYVLGPNFRVDLNPPDEPGLDVVRLGSGRAGRYELEVYCTELTVRVFKDGVETHRQSGSFLRFTLELAEASSHDVTLDRTNASDCRVVLYAGRAAVQDAPDAVMDIEDTSVDGGPSVDADGAGER